MRLIVAADIDDLIYRKNKKKKQLKEYKNRLKTIQKVESKIENIIDTAVGTVNKGYTSCNTMIANGISGISLNDEIIKTSFYEKNLQKDKYLREISAEINLESRRCIRKIEELEDDIDSLEMRIDRARESEDDD